MELSLRNSTDAGRTIMDHASNHLPKLVLELGGKAPFIVWHDADIPWALKCAIWARFWNCGQTCICSERMYVDEKIKDKFVPAFVRMAKDLVIGNPLESDTDLGPMVSREERETSMKFIAKAKEEGDKIIVGGEKPSAPTRGWFLEPTVIEDVKQKSSLVQDEIFGPVVPILEVDNFDKAIDYANDSKYGLASYIFTKDSTRVLKAMNRIRFGESYINQVGPEQLQGVHTGFRQSGLGGEGSRYGLEGYTQLKTCYVDWNDKPSLSYLFPYKSK